jgi:potassium-dependent mechanosensitive channel
MPLLQQLWMNLSNIFGTPLFQIGESPISLASFFQFVAALLLIVYLMRIFRQVLAMRLLIRLNIDVHNREAIATIISYSSGILGLILILQTIGFNVASLAVLAGGLGVGIGLGLQNLTVNFVSGMTILLTQKMRVGDFIDVDGIEGYIQEVSLQATVIRTRDGGDVIVPNHKLSDSRVMNWSYDTYTARIHVPVSVAYGSDLVTVTEALLECAYTNLYVVPDPPPKVIFLGFGNNAIDLELRVWINRIDLTPDIKSDLYFAIEDGLRRNEIEIPFPQLDLWVRQSQLASPATASQSLTSQSLPSEMASEMASQTVPDLAQTASHRAIASALSPKNKPRSLKTLLQQVDYFHHLTDLQLRQVIESGYRQKLQADEVLFREGDPGNAFYIILNGTVTVISEQLNKSLSELTSGQSFGELSLMLDIPRSATVRAVETTQLFVINNQGFKQLLSEYPKIYEVILKELEKHQEELAERQQQLRAMGLIDSTEDDKNLTMWVRKRLNRLFNV